MSNSKELNNVTINFQVHNSDMAEKTIEELKKIDQDNAAIFPIKCAIVGGNLVINFWGNTLEYSKLVEARILKIAEKHGLEKVSL